MYAPQFRTHFSFASSNLVDINLLLLNNMCGGYVKNISVGGTRVCEEHGCRRNTDIRVTRVCEEHGCVSSMGGTRV